MIHITKQHAADVTVNPPNTSYSITTKTTTGVHATNIEVYPEKGIEGRYRLMLTEYEGVDSVVRPPGQHTMCIMNLTVSDGESVYNFVAEVYMPADCGIADHKKVKP